MLLRVHIRIQHEQFRSFKKKVTSVLVVFVFSVLFFLATHWIVGGGRNGRIPRRKLRLVTDWVMRTLFLQNLFVVPVLSDPFVHCTCTIRARARDIFLCVMHITQSATSLSFLRGMRPFRPPPTILWVARKNKTEKTKTTKTDVTFF